MSVHLNSFRVSNGHSYPSHLSIYEEMIRRVNPEERKNVEAKLLQLPDVNYQVDQLIQAITCQNWHAPLFLHKDYPFYALRALKEGLLCPMQFATIQIFYSIHELGSLKVVPFFDAQGAVHPQAEILVGDPNIHHPDDVYLTPGIWPAFVKEMKALPRSEQLFFIGAINETELQENTEGGSYSILYEMNRLGFKLFGVVNGGKSYLFPTLGMMQAFLKAQFGSRCIEIKPVLGFSCENDILQNGLCHQRDFALPFPEVSLPAVLEDGYFVKSWRLWRHDYLHAYRASAIGSHRPIYIELAIYIQSANFREFAQAYIRACWGSFNFKGFYLDLIDMDFGLYPNKQITAVKAAEVFRKTLKNRIRDNICMAPISRNQSSIEEVSESLTHHLYERVKKELLSSSGWNVSN